MKNANITEVRDRLSEYLRIVRRGETVIIMDRDTPIARLEPVAPAGDQPHAYRGALAAGILIPPRIADNLLQTLPGPPQAKQSPRLLDALIEERRRSR